MATLSTSGASTSLRRLFHARRRLFEKDVLRVGVWEVDGKRWRVTPRTLDRIVQNWRLAHSRGVRVPVVWNHSHDARDQIGEIVDLYVQGGLLYARFWAADPDDVRKLGVTVNDVSVEVAEPWFDGAGLRYDIMLTHLGVVNFPVVPGQLPFKRLRLRQAGESSMHEQNGHAAAEDAAGVMPQTDGLERIDVSGLVEALNEVLAAGAYPSSLPEDTTLENLTPRLREVGRLLREDRAAGVEQRDGAEEPAELVRMRLDLDRARRELALERERQLAGERQTFVARLDQLIRQGRVSPAHREALLEAGQPARYSLSLLAPFDDVPPGSVVPVRRLSSSVADARPPSVGSAKAMTLERAQEIARSFRENH